MFHGNSGITAAPRSSDAENESFEDQTELAKMHEIDPKSEAPLSEALRRLAVSSPQGAPEELGAGLLTAFRRHHTRRRRNRQARIAGVVVLLALVAALVSTRNH